MTKQLLTGQEIRTNAKHRLKKHRDSMKKQGYLTVSVFMGESLRSELDRLGETGLTKHGALEHIFNGYRDSVYGVADADEPSIDINDITLDDIKDVTSNIDKGQDSKQLDMFEPDQAVLDPDTAKDTQTASNHIDLGDYHGQDMDTATKDKILIAVAEALPGPKNAQARVDMLNSAGVTCGKAGAAWMVKNLADNLYLAKKRGAK